VANPPALDAGDRWFKSSFPDHLSKGTPMLGTLRAMVENVEHELKYYKDAVDEQAKVIEQLHRGYALPGKPTYIHPADLSELINDHITSVAGNYVNVITDGWDGTVRDKSLVNIRGNIYKQSVHMPQITTKFR
jgi:hypothetical protein